MTKRRSTSCPALLIRAYVSFVIVIATVSLLARPALAGPLDEVTAPVNEAVETVVPPVVTPTAPPAPAPEQPPVQAPEVKVPEVPVQVPPTKLPEAPLNVPTTPVKVPEVKVPPVKVPVPPSTKAPSAPAVVETAKQTVEQAAGTVTKAAGNTTAAVDGVSAQTGGTTNSVEKTATTAGGTVQRSSGSATASPGKMAGAAIASSGASRGAVPSSPGNASPAGGTEASGSGLPASSGPAVDLARGLLQPFIHVWPAVALTGDRLLGGFVGDWSRSVLAALVGGAAAGPLGAAGLDGATTAEAVPASHSSDQPLFSWLTSPAIQPFNWVASSNALVLLTLLLVIGAATLTIVGLARRDLGLPMFRRGNRFPWRH